MPMSFHRSQRGSVIPTRSMKPKEIRNLTADEIRIKLREAREQLLQLRLRKQAGLVEKTHELRALRKDIARMLTIEREIRRSAASENIVK